MQRSEDGLEASDVSIPPKRTKTGGTSGTSTQPHCLISLQGATWFLFNESLTSSWYSERQAQKFFFFFLLILNEHLEWYLKVHISIRNFITFFPSLLDRSLSLHDWLRLSESPVRLGPASTLAGLGQRPSLGFYAVFGMLNHLLSGVMWTTEWAGQRFWRLMEKHGLWRSM